MTSEQFDVIWIIACAILVFIMQAGFACLESGLVRAKNSINVAIKNLVDFALAAACFTVVGATLMLGTSWHGLFGTTAVSMDMPGWASAVVLFQLVFCGTSATIVSGAIAERMKFLGYMATVVLVTCLVYPVVGHWVWGGVLTHERTGWLGALGFVDFAGAAVVHSVGGWVSLAAILVIGPRIGRFGPQRERFLGHNLALAVLGVFLLWFGWYGFSAGSTLAVSDALPRIVANTTLAGAYGGLAALGLALWRFRHPHVPWVINGVLAGLVAVTASADRLDSTSVIWVAAVGAGLCVGATLVLERFGVDDAVGAFPVHGVAGVWGVLAVPVAVSAAELPAGLGRWELLAVQALGVLAIGLWAFGVPYVVLGIIHRSYSLRVTSEEERAGLNLSEHALATDVVDELSRAREVAAESVAIVQNADEGIITIDERGLVERFNSAAEDIFGYGREEVVGRNVSMLMLPEDGLAHDAHLRRYAVTGEPHVIGLRREVTAVRKDGRRFPLEIAVSEVRGADRVFFTAVVRDVSEKKRELHELEEQALRDQLTGIYNRRYLDSSLEREVAQAVRYGKPISFIMVDVDHFKRVNDTYGHVVGDCYLTGLARFIAGTVRSADIVARYGGEEIAVVLPHTGLAEARILAERLREGAARIVVDADGESVRTTISAGVAQFDGDASHPSGDGENSLALDLVAAADRALYTAKHGGRNRVCVAEQLSSGSRAHMRIEAG